MPSRAANLQQILEQAAAHFKKGDMQAAESACRGLLSRDPWNLPAKNLLAGIFRQTDRLNEALQLMLEIVNLSPNTPEFHINCAELQISLQQLAQAEASYRKAIALRANYSKPWVQLGIVLRRLGRVKESIECLERALQLDKANVPALLELAEIAYDQSRTSDQLFFSNAALQLEPTNALARRI